MPDVDRTPEADRDLEQIARTIANDSPSAALAWLGDMESVFRLLSTQPEIGEHRHTRRLGHLRRHTRGNYVIYYRPVADGVQIARVLHSARDEKRHT